MTTLEAFSKFFFLQTRWSFLHEYNKCCCLYKFISILMYFLGISKTHFNYETIPALNTNIIRRVSLFDLKLTYLVDKYILPSYLPIFRYPFHFHCYVVPK